jgi:hypothetical protein
MTATPADAGSPSAGAETCTCPFLTRGVHVRGCPAVPSPEDTVEPGPRVIDASAVGVAEAYRLASPTPPAVRTGKDDGAVRQALLAWEDTEEGADASFGGMVSVAFAAGWRAALSARPLVSGTANHDDAITAVYRLLVAQPRDHASRYPNATAIVDAVLLALLGGDQDDELAEWQCPSCGATTRARMADQDDEDGAR